jgi:hypothetical protein
VQLPIEQWLTTQTLTQDARDLFAESAVCFKAGAYRAALLFSYLGFQSTIRDRVLAADPPTGVTPPHWASIQKNLRGDETWDAKAFEATQDKKHQIFVISDELRGQIEYWKNRRNDCAHSKANAIGSPYVESFYLFVQSNLAKMVVNGSSQGLLGKIVRHFDPTFTSPGTDPLPLAMELASAIDRHHMADFFDQLVGAFSTSSLLGTFVRGESVVFFDAIYRQPDVAIQTAFWGYLCAREDLLVSLLRYSPVRVILLSGQSQLLRRLWTVHAFANGYPDFVLYAALLRNRLLPQSDIPLANQQAVDRMRGGIPAPADAEVLFANGFITAFDKQAFEDGDVDRFTWGNPNALTVKWRLEHFSLTDVVVVAICSKFNSEPCARDARDALIQLFHENPAKRIEFQTIATRLTRSLPSLIHTLR